MYYYRDSQHHEVDVIYKCGSELVPIEIKSGQTLSNNFFKNLDYFRKLTGQRCGQPYLIYAGEQELTFNETHIVHYRNSHKVIEASEAI